jgi:hypothetical protein
MKYRNAHKAAKERSSSYAASEDFGTPFNEDAQSLYLLSFLLTANHEKLQKCVVDGLGDCIEGDPAFRQGLTPGSDASLFATHCE